MYKDLQESRYNMGMLPNTKNMTSYSSKMYQKSLHINPAVHQVIPSTVTHLARMQLVSTRLRGMETPAAAGLRI